jgi:hypothetical protein
MLAFLRGLVVMVWVGFGMPVPADDRLDTPWNVAIFQFRATRLLPCG